MTDQSFDAPQQQQQYAPISRPGYYQQPPQYYQQPQYPPQYFVQPQYRPVRPSNGFGITAFVTGLLSIFPVALYYVMTQIGVSSRYYYGNFSNIIAITVWGGTFLAIVAIVFGIIGIVKSRKSGRKGLAIAGLSLGGLEVLVFLGLLLNVIH